MSFLYKALRPFLFMLDPEKAHGLTIAILKYGLLPRIKIPETPILRSKVCGIDFAHPIGLAAGFDKHAEVMDPAFSMGFSFIELGTITPLPQSGNDRPRMFRIPSAKAAINRFGFNSIGAEAFLQRLIAYHQGRTNRAGKIIGINLGKNKVTEDAGDDYVKGVMSFATHAHYLTINVSSPNTPGLRDMQERGALTELLKRVMEARAHSSAHPPIFLKIAPDINEQQAQDIADVALASGIDGIIVGNTTLSRPASIPDEVAKEAGGLSGKPLFNMSTSVLARMYQLTQGKIPLIGCGGVSSGADAYAKVRAGASLIQLYTALVYEGPGVVRSIVKELAALVKKDGFASVTDAVGADFKLKG